MGGVYQRLNVSRWPWRSSGSTGVMILGVSGETLVHDRCLQLGRYEADDVMRWAPFSNGAIRCRRRRGMSVAIRAFGHAAVLRCWRLTADSSRSIRNCRIVKQSTLEGASLVPQHRDGCPLLHVYTSPVVCYPMILRDWYRKNAQFWYSNTYLMLPSLRYIYITCLRGRAVMAKIHARRGVRLIWKW